MTQGCQVPLHWEVPVTYRGPVVGLFYCIAPNSPQLRKYDNKIQDKVVGFVLEADVVWRGYSERLKTRSRADLGL